MATRELIYVGDAMCSWCWGFSPVLDAIRKKYSAQLPLRIVVGGLRPGPGAEKLDAKLKEFLRHEWTKIREVTKQPFDTKFLDRDGFLYDTHPASCAVVAMRRLKPEAELEFFKAVQKAFYADGVDITKPENFAPLAKAFGIDGAKFVKELTSDASHRAAVEDYQEAAKRGVRGFPSLLLRIGDGQAVLSHGYQPFKALEPLIDKAMVKAAK